MTPLRRPYYFRLFSHFCYLRDAQRDVAFLPPMLRRACGRCCPALICRRDFFPERAFFPASRLFAAYWRPQHGGAARSRTMLFAAAEMRREYADARC